MKYLNKYNNYLIDRLLESVLVTTKEFRDIINDMPSNNKIADILYNIIRDETDIKTNYNFIDSSADKNDEITFLPDSQYQRFISKGEDPSSKTKNSTSVGRMIRQILKDNKVDQSVFTDADIEKFVNSFKTTWNKKHGITNRKIEIVKGKDILKWYNIENYNSTNGTLGNSCMRYTKVNHFMNIYAENPDKISMVILTEDGKLLARALFWNIDELDNSKRDKVYLDRIYAEQDSDVDFVYDWVLENVLQKDRSKLLSHRNSNNLDYVMKIFLNKTTFEHYPYADSFNYLYQRLDENKKLTGDGYLSNSRRLNEEVTNDFVVSEIRNHSEGYPGRLSHFYSDKLEMFIVKQDAIYDSEYGYVLRSMCKKSEYEDEWIYEERAVWSESMQDWILKENAVESEKFGIVHKDEIIKLVTEYLGTDDNPIDFCENLNNGSFKVEEIYKGEADIEYDIPEYRYGLSYMKFSKELLGKDFWNEWQIKDACFEYFDCGDYDEKQIESLLGELSLLCYDYNGRAYLTKENAELFGFTPNFNRSKLYAFQDYKSRWERLSYSKYISSINNSTISEQSKEKLTLIANKTHSWLMKNNVTYRFNFNIDEKMRNVDTNDLFYTCFDKVWSKLMEKEQEYVNNLEGEFEYYSIEWDDDNQNLASNIVAGISLFYLLTEDSNESVGYVRNFVFDNYKLKTRLNDVKRQWSPNDFIELCRMVFRDSFLNEQRVIQNEELNKIAKTYDLSLSEIKRFFSLKIDKVKINPFKE